MGQINYFTEDVKFSISNPRKTKSWLIECAASEGCEIGSINFIFCSDRYLLTLNRGYLKHKTLTDIITFDNSDGSPFLEGDIFISVERVEDNALTFEVEAALELRRVMVHGLLHLIGYKDKAIRERSLMRKKEDLYLSLWK